MGVELESSELHTRVAAWLTRRGFPYIHEYKNKLDFLTINPQTGEVTIIECKMEVGITSHVIWQLNEYHDFLGVSAARRFCITLNPLRNFQRAEFEMNGITCLIFALSMSKIDCLPSRITVPAFNEVFQRFNGGKTLDDARREYNALGMDRIETIRLSNAEIDAYIKLERAQSA